MSSKTHVRSNTIDTGFSAESAQRPPMSAAKRVAKHSTSLEQWTFGAPVVEGLGTDENTSTRSTHAPPLIRADGNNDEKVKTPAAARSVTRADGPTHSKFPIAGNADDSTAVPTLSSPSEDVTFKVHSALNNAGAEGYQTLRLSIIQVEEYAELHQDLSDRSDLHPDALLRFLMQNMTVRSTFDAERVTKRHPKIVDLAKTKHIAALLKDLKVSLPALEGLQRQLEDPTQTPAMNSAFTNVGEVRGRNITILDVAFLREAGESDPPDAHLLYTRMKVEAAVRPAVQRGSKQTDRPRNDLEFVVLVDKRAFCLRDSVGSEMGESEGIGEALAGSGSTGHPRDGESKGQREALLRFLRMLGEKGKKVARWDAVTRGAKLIVGKTMGKGHQDAH